MLNFGDAIKKTSRSQPYLTFRPLFSWKIPEKLSPRLDLLYVAPASPLPSSAHQLLLRLSQGAVFAAEDGVDVDDVDDVDEVDGVDYVDGLDDVDVVDDVATSSGFGLLKSLSSTGSCITSACGMEKSQTNSVEEQPRAHLYRMAGFITNKADLSSDKSFDKQAACRLDLRLVRRLSWFTIHLSTIGCINNM